MRKKKINLNNNRIKSNRFFFLIIFLLFCVFIGRLSYLCLVDYKVGNSTITAFIENRNMESEVLLPNRGSILDSKGNVLAEDITSYTIIAYLDSSRSEGTKTLQHVSDVDYTAKTLAPYLDMEVEDLKKILSKKAYQVELGPKGRNLTQIQKEEIEALKLPGIDFEKSTKRYYPNGTFASYLLGYTVNKNDDDNNTWKVGEMGIESYFNDTLTGTAGNITYERDRYGYTIANGREYVEEANDGDDIYLTIDSNIQLFVENALSKALEESEAELGIMVVADAKTGSILAYGSNPSFDPNVRDIKSYLDPISGYAYEPGSVMKIFSYMCDIENGLYKGDDIYTSGSMTYKGINGSSITIKDWNKTGWGDITYDRGFALSSNIAIANLVQNGLNKKILKSCYDSYGFGEKTGFPLYGEEDGNVEFNYDVEVATAGYGQGINVTAIQIVQALTSITNDGELLKPYVVSKIVDSVSGEVTYAGQREVIDKVVSSETISKIKELMSSVICNDMSLCTGSSYYMEDYPMIGKTGTAQIWDETKRSYKTGSSDYIYSFAGIYPTDDPEIIIYMALKEPKDTTNYVAPAVKDVVVNVSKYLNINTDSKESNPYKVETYLNKSLTAVKSELEKKGLNVISLGDIGKIVSQYPSAGSTIYSGDTVILISSDYNNKMIDLKGLSYKEALTILSFMNINYEIEGTGYVYEQSIKVGETFTSNDTISIKLQEKYIN